MLVGLSGRATAVAPKLFQFLTASSEHVRRLDEFGTTGSGALTLDEFFDIELEEECDPPSFTRGRITAQEKAMLKEVGHCNTTRWRPPYLTHSPRPTHVQSDLSEVELTLQMKEVMGSSDFAEASKGISSTELVPVARKRAAHKGMRTMQHYAHAWKAFPHNNNNSTSSACTLRGGVYVADVFYSSRRWHIDTYSPTHVYACPPTPEGYEDEEDDPDNLSDVDDPEIEAMILGEEEVAIRTELWTELNKEYLEQQEGMGTSFPPFLSVSPILDVSAKETIGAGLSSISHG